MIAQHTKFLAVAVCLIASLSSIFGYSVHAEPVESAAEETAVNEQTEQTSTDDQLISFDDPEQPADDLDEDNDLAELSLEELMDFQVVVTASRHEQKITTVPYAISVVTAQDIRASGARSIADALRLVPGMDVAELSYSNAAVSPRGFNGFVANRVLVLVDGRQIFDSLFGGTLWGSWPFQLEDIARIEVIRGPGGVTWGANASNGVINIITKDPADQLGLTHVTTVGSRGTFKQYWSRAVQDGKLRLRISGEYEASDGFNKGGSFLRKLDDDYKAGRLTLHAIYDQDDDNTYTFSAGSAIVDGGYPPTPLAGFGQRRNSGSQTAYILAKWNHHVAENNDFELTGYVNDFQVSPGVPSIDYRYQQIGFLFSHTYKPSETQTRTWGVDTRVDLFEAGNSDPFLLTKNFVSTAIIGVYLQDEWLLAPRWTLNLGGRIDYEFYGGFQPSARLSLSHELKDGTFVYGSVSRSFQMSPVGIRFVRLPLLNGLISVTSNQSIKPSILIAYELGYRGRLFNHIETNVNLYWHQYNEIHTLQFEPGPPGLLRSDNDNRQGQASLYGIEADLKYAISDKLTLVGNYTYQQLNWNISGQFVDTDFITPPKNKAMLGTRYAVTDDFRVAGNLFYVDAVSAHNPGNPFQARKIDPYLRLDINAEYEFWEDNASISIGVKNLLDPQHYEGSTWFLNDAQVPRMVFAEFRVKIK